ncbi:hypothetical protein F443_02136 [Phytophthora nicotianae P1569]|uniref:Crinkler effector protein N-terminal domain-containing protein n=1 Tax=Phytophthora nicotianae P1569 TaxID=1317065 RepID=V9FWL9_PHYNI|nr:hypothetical protein F443_02136 [Phytophthora nicotianae P1569]
MVKLFCAIVGVAYSAFPVDIDASQLVGDLKKVIKEKKPDTIKCEADKLQLSLAKKGAGWLPSAELRAIRKGEDLPGFERVSLVDTEDELYSTYSIRDVLDTNGMPPPQTRQIHVLVEVPPRERHDSEKEERAVKKVKTIGTEIQDETMMAVAATLDFETWDVGGVVLNVCNVEPDFPQWLYVRKETLDIIQIFKDHIKNGFNTVFVGTPGVGKSTLVVLFALYMALCQKKRIILFRKIKSKGYSVLYMDASNKRYWRKESAELSDLNLVNGEGFELILDGFTQDDVNTNFGRLARFRLLATSQQYLMQNDDISLWRCLVPFWSSSDLNIIGAHFRWTENDIKEKYFYSGGNLRDFLSPKIKAKDSIDQALGRMDENDAELLHTQYARGSKKQVDRLRMTSIRPDPANKNNLDKYKLSSSWVSAITSEYALRQLGKIITPSYYEKLWSKGRVLGDDALMGIAFENYVHAMARVSKEIELQVSEYDRTKQHEHTYAPLELKASTYRSEGRDEAECEAMM